MDEGLVNDVLLFYNMCGRLIDHTCEMSGRVFNGILRFLLFLCCEHTLIDEADADRNVAEHEKPLLLCVIGHVTHGPSK